MKGELSSLEITKKPGELLLNLTKGFPREVESWKGMSGSAVFTTDGYLVGIIIQGAKELEGRQLEVVSLEHVVESNAEFLSQVEKNFQRRIAYVDIEKDNAAAAFDLTFRIQALKLRKKLSAVEASEIDLAIDRDERELKRKGLNVDWGKPLSFPPKQQLFELLLKLGDFERETFWSAWKASVVSKITHKRVNVEEACILLLDLRDTDLICQFLSSLWRLLLQADKESQYLKQLKDLSITLYEFDLAKQTLSVNPKNKNEELSHSQGCLLVKIESKQRPGCYPVYSLSAWMVGDRQAYQKRFKFPSDQSSILESDTERVADKVLIEADSNDIEIQLKFVKQKVSEILNKLWENLGLEHMKPAPEVVFFVPIQLLGIDFQNIELTDDDLLLGWMLPVSVSCLERYEEERFMNEDAKLRKRWIERWQVLERFHDESLLSHLEIHDEKVVDITNPRKLRHWLLLRDQARKAERRVSGIGFYAPHEEFMRCFLNFLKHGLPIIFWPSCLLQDCEAASLKKSLEGAVPLAMLSAIQGYRSSCGADSAGAVSVLLDNPYLCPPDCDIDYY